MLFVFLLLILCIYIYMLFQISASFCRISTSTYLSLTTIATTPLQNSYTGFY